jgi:hypothetical protein
MAVVVEVAQDYTVRLSVDKPGPGKWYRAYAGEPDLEVASTPGAVDRWAPFGVPLSYFWVDSDGVQQAPAPVTVTSDRPVLSSATGSGYMTVTVVTQPPLRWEGRSVAHDVLYRPEPVVTVAPASYHTATMRFHVPGMMVRAELRSLLARGEPLILRTPCASAVDDVTFLPVRFTEELVSASRPGGDRWMDVEYRAVMDNPTAYRPLPDWSWDELEAAFDSWDAVEAAYATWDQVEAGPP